jgi:hypothetical protein
MAPVIVGVLAGAGAAALNVGLQGVISVALMAASVTYSIQENRKMKKELAKMKQQASGMLITQRDPVGTHSVLYGTRRIGGVPVFIHATGNDNKYLHMVIALGGRKLHAIKKVYFNEEECDIIKPGDVIGEWVINNPDGTVTTIPKISDKWDVTGSLKGLARVKPHLGEDDQETDADLMAEAPNHWTEAHRGRGIPYIYVRLQHNSEKYPNGCPQISVLAEGAEVYDPRDGQTKFTDNPALCARDFISNNWIGLGATPDEMDDMSFIAGANTCEEQIELKDGTYQNRYTCNGVCDSGATPKENLDNLETSFSGNIIYTDGKWRICAGAARPVAATFTIDDITGPLDIQTADSMAESCNRVKGTYSAPENKWQPSDFPPAVNDGYLEEDGGRESWRDINLPFTTNPVEAQRLAKIGLEKSRQDITATVRLNLKGLRADVCDVVQLPIERYGWNIANGKKFEVEHASFTVSDGGTGDSPPVIGIALSLREYAPEAYDWNKGEETEVDPAPDTNLPNISTVAPPINVVLASGAETAFVQPDGTVVPRLKVSWNQSGNALVTSGGRVRVQYMKVLEEGEGDWTEWAALDGAQVFDYITDVREDDVYAVRVRFENNPDQDKRPRRRAREQEFCPRHQRKRVERHRGRRHNHRAGHDPGM